MTAIATEAISFRMASVAPKGPAYHAPSGVLVSSSPSTSRGAAAITPSNSLSLPLIGRKPQVIDVMRHTPRVASRVTKVGGESCASTLPSDEDADDARGPFRSSRVQRTKKNQLEDRPSLTAREPPRRPDAMTTLPPIGARTTTEAEVKKRPHPPASMRLRRPPPRPVDDVDEEDRTAALIATEVLAAHEAAEIADFERRSGLDGPAAPGPSLSRGGAQAANRAAAVASPSSPTSQSSHHTVTSVDEEASVRMLKVMFQLNVTHNSRVMHRLRQLDASMLERRVNNEVGYKRQLSREDFCSLLAKLLKDDYLNRRDCLTLFSIFDDDRSGVVDSAEFVPGFVSLVTSGTHDIAFKFIATLLEGREKSTVNAFISRFELQMLMQAAQQYFQGDDEVVALLEKLPDSFRFSHHLGRIPVMELREAILSDPDMLAILSALPASHGAGHAATAAAASPSSTTGRRAQRVGGGGGGGPSFAGNGAATSNNSNNNNSLAGSATGENNNNSSSMATGRSMMAHEGSSHVNSLRQQDLTSLHFVADQYMQQQAELQAKAAEHDAPVWWTLNNVVYRRTRSQPDPQPVFLKDK